MGAALFALAYVELFSGGANLPGRPPAEFTGALHTVWNPDWSIIRVYAYHAMLLSVLMAMALMDQDRQRIPWTIVAFALAIAAVGSSQWWDLYPERTRAVRVKEYKAVVDALGGIAWAALPLATAAAIFRQRGQDAAATALGRLAIGLGTVGGFLGLRAVVRTAVIWVALVLLGRFAPAPISRVGKLTWLWLATLMQIIFWRQLAAIVSW